MSISPKFRKKLNHLISFLNKKKIIIAFSGGVDSSLLAYLSKRNASKTLLITENSILYPDEEIKLTTKFAQKHHIPHRIIERNPLKDEEFKQNHANRCYLCKKGLYSDILKLSNELDFDFIVDGTNYDDLSDYRPGIKAVHELGIKTPYIQYEITKEDIRKISAFYNLKISSKPSMACFSSRIPYFQRIKKEKLERIEKAEKFLINHFNLEQLRVRHHENKLARIELIPEDIPKLLDMNKLRIINDYLKILGFNYVTIDLDGFRSGSMNEVLSEKMKFEIN